MKKGARRLSCRRNYRIDVGGGLLATISTRRFCGLRTPSGVATRKSFWPRPVTTMVPGGTPSWARTAATDQNTKTQKQEQTN